MYITQEADYAVRIVYCLAKSQGRRDARSISEEVAVSLRFSLKILGKLSNTGMVKSFKGNRGGYELARPAADITLQEVLSAVDGPYVLSRCIRHNACNCDALGSCAFRRVYSQISQEVNRQLADVSFQALLEEDRANCG